MNEQREGFMPEEVAGKPSEVQAESLSRDRFEAVVEANYQSYLRYALRQLSKNPKDQSDADAVVQEACLNAYAHLKEIREGEAGLSALIYRTIAHVITDRWRRSDAQKRKGTRVYTIGKDDSRDVLEAQPSREPSAFERLAAKDLEKAVAGLPPIYRDVVALEVEEPDLMVVEKAARLGIGEGAYKSRLLRARNRLEEMGYHN